MLAGIRSVRYWRQASLPARSGAEVGINGLGRMASTTGPTRIDRGGTNSIMGDLQAFAPIAVRFGCGPTVGSISGWPLGGNRDRTSSCVGRPPVQRALPGPLGRTDVEPGDTVAWRMVPSLHALRKGCMASRTEAWPRYRANPAGKEARLQLPQSVPATNECLVQDGGAR